MDTAAEIMLTLGPITIQLPPEGAGGVALGTPGSQRCLLLEKLT